MLTAGSVSFPYGSGQKPVLHPGTKRHRRGVSRLGHGSIWKEGGRFLAKAGVFLGP